MGLDTTHDCWHGSYSSFNAWRNWLCTQFGVNINKLQGYGGTEPILKKLPEELFPLINHSDCEGSLSVEECKKTLSVLRSIVSTAKEIPVDYAKDKYYIEKTEQFIKGLKQAIKKNESVEFH